MIKKLLVGACLLGATLTTTGCNEQLFDTTYKFDRVIICMPDGTMVEGKVESWIEYEDSDAIQIKVDGSYYYTHLQNVLLIAD